MELPQAGVPAEGQQIAHAVDIGPKGLAMLVFAEDHAGGVVQHAIAILGDPAA